MLRLIFVLCFLLFLSLPFRVFAQVEPYIQIVPNSPVANGQQVTLYGSGFCADSNCSSVKVENGNLLIDSGVKVNSDGKLQLTFKANGVLGSNTITATQTAADGSTVKASTGIVFAATDYLPSSTPSPWIGNSSSPLPSPLTTISPLSKPSPHPTSEAQASTEKDGVQIPGDLFFENKIAAILIILTALATAFYFAKKRPFRK